MKIKYFYNLNTLINMSENGKYLISWATIVNIEYLAAKSQSRSILIVLSP